MVLCHIQFNITTTLSRALLIRIVQMTDFKIFKFAQFCHIQFIVIIERNHPFRAYMFLSFGNGHTSNIAYMYSLQYIQGHTLKRQNEFWLAIQNQGVTLSF